MHIMYIKHYNSHGYSVDTQSKGASGFDLHCTEGRTIMPGEVHVVGTGSYFEIPDDFEGEVSLRSSYGKKGLVIPNAPGVIDSDYRGEVKVVLANISNNPVELVKGHRIAQIRFGVVLPFVLVNVDAVEDLGETDRGNGGFGSTGNE